MAPDIWFCADRVENKYYEERIIEINVNIDGFRGVNTRTPEKHLNNHILISCCLSQMKIRMRTAKMSIWRRIFVKVNL